VDSYLIHIWLEIVALHYNRVPGVGYGYFNPEVGAVTIFFLQKDVICPPRTIAAISLQWLV
jgi:hypothetical protein